MKINKNYKKHLYKMIGMICSCFSCPVSHWLVNCCYNIKMMKKLLVSFLSTLFYIDVCRNGIFPQTKTESRRKLNKTDAPVKTVKWVTGDYKCLKLGNNIYKYTTITLTERPPTQRQRNLAEFTPLALNFTHLFEFICCSSTKTDNFF